MASLDNGEEDEFFGADNDDDSPNDNALARHESNAAATKLQTVAYLDAFDQHKESQLQEGFESGYREVFDITSRLGEILGKITARAKIQSFLTQESTTTTSQEESGFQTRTQEITRQFRQVMDKINQSEGNNKEAKQILLNLEQDANLLVSEYLD